MVDSSDNSQSLVIIGGGPAGLTAAHELALHGLKPLILERDNHVGGLSRTESYKGYRFDIGGHRFYTKVDEVRRFWREMLGDDLIRVPRLSRIFYHGRFLNYPIEPINAMLNLGIIESVLTALSYLRARLFPYPEEETFEQWVSNRFGRRLYRTFFKTYTEKVWGIPCHIIQADWAAQRIQGLSFTTAVSDAVFGSGNLKTLAKEFDYPVLGPGMMWEAVTTAIRRLGGRIELGCQVTRIGHAHDRITRVSARRGGEMTEIACDHLLASMPITELVRCLDPLPPGDVLIAADRLHYRAFMLIALVVNRAHIFPDNWIYVHSPDIRVGRIQNFKNWSAAMVPDARKTSLGMEYFCDEGDALWNLADEELIALAKDELQMLGLARTSEVEDGVVIRQSKAYPVYDSGYREQLRVLRRFLDCFSNLQMLGRNGMHRYNNIDHSMLTGLRAARNILGGSYDLWDVNAESSYHEERVT